jgi:3-hydroxyacyl-CoA dehydrogenase
MGPFTLLDYAGLDTAMWIAGAFYDEYKEHSKHLPRCCAG